MEKEKSFKEADDRKYIPITSSLSKKGFNVLPDLFHYTTQIVNIQCIGDAKEFVLIDTGMTGNADMIIHTIEEHYGKGKKPIAIVLTHGHFDHVGNIVTLLEKWDIPVYAHRLEGPYLTGEKAYPTPDASVEGGMIAKMSPLFSTEPIDISSNLHLVDTEIEVLPQFQLIHTPGHAEGHISLFREKDKLLIAGDAFTFVKQDTLLDVLTQKQTIQGPPRYLTTDWEAAKHSVEKLLDLQPEIAVAGHGIPMKGEVLRKNLAYLVDHFDEMAKPDYGRFVSE